MNTTKMNFKKVSDIQQHVKDQLKKYSWENDLSDFGFTNVEFTTKKADLKLQTTNSAGYLVHSSTIHATLSEKDYQNLYVSCSIDIHGSNRMMEDKHLSSIISILCSYWVLYRDFKKMKRLLFGWSDYRKHYNPDIFSNAVKRLGFKPLRNSVKILDSKWGGYKEGAYIQENDDELKRAEYVQDQIDKAQEQYPSFVVEKSLGGLVKIYGNVYFYENENFTLDLSDDKDNILLYRKGKETLSFPLEDGVIFNILSHIREEMKLLNLLKPSTKQLSYFCKEHMKLGILKDTVLEDKVSYLDEFIGVGETENELYLINQLIAKQSEERDNRYNVTKEKIHFFKLKKEQTEYFSEHYGDEFVFYYFETKKYHWFIMLSKNEKDVWFYPCEESKIPEKAKADAKKVFDLRRIPEAMSKINEALLLLKTLDENKMLKIHKTRMNSLSEDLRKLGEREFGIKWREENNFTS